MADTLALSFGTPNFSGALFNKGNTRTPFSAMIGANRLQTNHVEFATGVEFETAVGKQPSISEETSLIAPDSSVITRDQKTNVTQIFQYTTGISDAKRSNMGTLSGINVAGQQANPAEELQFQLSAKFAEMAQDVEYTFINGVFAKATNDTQANQTRGILNAITSNIVDADGKGLTFMLVCEALKSIQESNGDLSNIVIGVDPITRLQLNADAAANGLTIVDTGRNINGINVVTVLTPLGNVQVADFRYLPVGTALLFDPRVMRPVEQPVPGKGNFYAERLARVGAGDRIHIFGQVGLDHGPEWYAAKITGLSTDMPVDADFARRIQSNP